LPDDALHRRVVVVLPMHAVRLRLDGSQGRAGQGSPSVVTEGEISQRNEGRARCPPADRLFRLRPVFRPPQLLRARDRCTSLRRQAPTLSDDRTAAFRTWSAYLCLARDTTAISGGRSRRCDVPQTVDLGPSSHEGPSRFWSLRCRKNMTAYPLPPAHLASLRATRTANGQLTNTEARHGFVRSSTDVRFTFIETKTLETTQRTILVESPLPHHSEKAPGLPHSSVRREGALSTTCRHIEGGLAHTYVAPRVLLIVMSWEPDLTEAGSTRQTRGRSA
jgi:hypothetical protein